MHFQKDNFILIFFFFFLVWHQKSHIYEIIQKYAMKNEHKAMSIQFSNTYDDINCMIRI